MGTQEALQTEGAGEPTGPVEPRLQGGPCGVHLSWTDVGPPTLSPTGAKFPHSCPPQCGIQSRPGLVEHLCPRLERVSFLTLPATLPQVVMTSDASCSWGWGAWHGNAWFQLQWDQRSQSLSIAKKELLSILLDCLAWGQNWAGHHVVCCCNNQVVVACIW